MNHTARKTAAIALAVAAALFAAPAGAEDSGWTVATLPASDATMLQTAGTPLYAYRGASTAMTLGDVTFQAGADLSGANIAFDPAFTEANANAGGSSLLGSAWNFGASQGMDEIRLTLSGLTSGHEYLVQILARNAWGNTYITIGDLPRVNIQSGNGSSGAMVYGTIRAVGTSHDVVFKMGGSGAARYVAAVQVRDLGVAAPSVADPSIGSASVSVSGSTATFSLGGIVLGTDAQGTAATSYSVSYSLTNAAPVTALLNQSGATASFDIANLADGAYACVVTVATDGSKSVSTNLSFTVGGAVPGAGWTSGPMSSTGDTIRTDGTLLYAYAVFNVTVGGVTFASATDLTDATMVSASPVSAGHVFGDFQKDGATGGFGSMLESGWYWGGNGSASGVLTATLTLTGLTAGKNYLVQLVSHRQSNSTLVSANGSTPVHIHGDNEANCKYGASIVGIFTATGATKDVVVTYSEGSSGMRPLNAIQVRELPSGGASSAGCVIFVQ